MIEGNFMKKFFLTLIIFFAVASTSFAATQVRVSDYNLNEFYHAYNNVATALKIWTFDEFPNKAWDGDAYDMYLASCGPKGHGVLVGYSLAQWQRPNRGRMFGHSSLQRSHGFGSERTGTRHSVSSVRKQNQSACRPLLRA